MNNRLRRKELRMIKKNNQNENKQRIIPMYYDDELNRKVVTPICLPLINHPNKLILKIIDEETKNLLNQLFENGKCGDYIKDVINNILIELSPMSSFIQGLDTSFAAYLEMKNEDKKLEKFIKAKIKEAKDAKQKQSKGKQI